MKAKYGVAAALAAAGLTVATAGTALAATTTLTSVTITGTSASPTVTVTGSGFLPEPSQTAATNGYTGQDFTDSGATEFLKTSAKAFASGAPNDSLGLIVSTYTDTSMVFTFGSAYGASQSGGYVLNSGDAIKMKIHNATCTGTFTYGATLVCASSVPAALPDASFALGLPLAGLAVAGGAVAARRRRKA